MKKFWLKIVSLILVLFVSAGVIFSGIYFVMPHAYDNSYQKGFVYQYQALKNSAVDEPKIIVFGGSYMNFSVDSEQLSEYTGMPVYTLGVHGSMGMCYTIELVKENIREGDMVVFPFYPFEEDDYGMDLIYLTLEGESDMFCDFFQKHPFEVLRSAGSGAYRKVTTLLSNRFNGVTGDEPQTNVYDSRSFDVDTGNFIYDRPECIATDEYLEDMYQYDIADIDSSCYEILNELNQYCEEQGAALYITFAPCYEKAVSSTDDELVEYENVLQQNLQAEIISTIAENLMKKDECYNGRMHLNNAGTARYTEQLYEDLKKFVTFEN